MQTNTEMTKSPRILQRHTAINANPVSTTPEYTTASRSPILSPIKTKTKTTTYSLQNSTPALPTKYQYCMFASLINTTSVSTIRYHVPTLRKMKTKTKTKMTRRQSLNVNATSLPRLVSTTSLSTQSQLSGEGQQK
jgi:hypothetical protein